ncbi:hypothetical protein MZO42_20535 [Sphingomonas psychrotolerans]|uniref:Homogentisate 1,2-dioxygenase n=1 Tax=Sphingomonas psychrotolerans TaxID=1327635 RepID=A0ABU3N9L2_9SPHN|nr:hypothetical protein [Sphingomonas psychrotolerans]MDT8761093.1 hypothetical protein [Sphingomonas psychrotolerans]
MLLTALALTIVLPQQCRSYDTRLPRPLASWTRSGQGLDTRHAVTLDAGRDGKLATTVRIRKPGTFGIAIDRDGWIDVAPGRGRPLRMASESRGPACSTIRKIVRYKLRPGTYRVTVNRLKASRARLMLVHY